MRAVSNALPLIVILLILWVLVSVALIVSLQRTDGQLVYTLDDAYIHMAIAKTLTLQGVWGVGGDRFTPASSSPLWTLLLAGGYVVCGVNV